jgi:hypothetical protein
VAARAPDNRQGFRVFLLRRKLVSFSSDEAMEKLTSRDSDN